MAGIQAFPAVVRTAADEKVLMMLADACATQGARLNMDYGAGEPFIADTGLTLTNATVASGYCANTLGAGLAHGTQQWAAHGVSPYPTAALDGAAVLSDGTYIYMLGGTPNGTVNYTTVYRTTLASYRSGSPTWESWGSLPTAQGRYLSVLSDDTYVYVLGGYNGSANYTTVYRTTLAALQAGTQTWTAHGSLPASSGYAISVLSDGTYVYVIGGYSTTYYTVVYRTTLAALQAGTQTWTTWGSLPSTGYAMSVLSDGTHVYIIGGYNGSANYTTVYRTTLAALQAGTQTWTAWGSLPEGSMRLSAVILDDTDVLLIGGYSTAYFNAAYQTTLAALQAGTQKWSIRGNLPTASLQASAVISDGTYAYLLGGYDTANYTVAYRTTLASLESGTQTWEPWGALPTANGRAMSALSDGTYVYIVGGYNGSTFYTTVYRTTLAALQAGTQTWTAWGSLPTSAGNNMSVLSDGTYVYVIGGYSGSVNYTVVYRTTLAALQAGTQTWEAHGSLPTANGTALSVVSDGTYVYVIGGLSSTAKYTVVYRTTLAALQAGTQTWTAWGSLPTSPAYYMAPLLINNVIYVIGGYNNVANYTTVNKTPLTNVNAATVLLDEIAVTDAASGRIVFTGYNADAPEPLDVGNTGNDLLEVYPTIDGVPGAALEFTSAALGDNRWRFTSPAIPLTGAQTFGVKLQSFARSIAPNFRIYEVLFVWSTGATVVIGAVGDNYEAALYANLLAMARQQSADYGLPNGRLWACADAANLALTNAAIESGYARNTVGAGLAYGTQTWAAHGVSPYPTATLGSAAVLSDGTYIYILGGTPNGTVNYTTVYRTTLASYRSGAPTWESWGSLPTAQGRNMSVLSDGTYVYVIGGYSGSVNYTVVYRTTLAALQAGTQTWAAWGNLPTAQATILSAISDGTYIYVIGGTTGTANYTVVYRTTLAALQAGTQTWAAHGSLPTSSGYSMSALSDGTYVYVIGGHTGSAGYTVVYRSTLAALQAGTQTWTTHGSLPSGVAWAQSVLLDGTDVLIIGGYDGAYFSSVYRTTLTNVLEATITGSSYALTGAAAGRLILRGYNADATAALDIGNSGSNKIEVYQSIDGNTTWSDALAVESVESLGDNLYQYTMVERDLTDAAGLGFKLQSSVVNFRLLDVLAIWRDA